MRYALAGRDQGAGAGHPAAHKPPKADAQRGDAWKSRLAPYYREFGLDPSAPVQAANRTPFAEIHCELIEELRPAVASFHFGLPEERLLARVKTAGCKVLSSATTVAEARWLEARGVDAIIAQGAEAGGHRGMFLTDDVMTQPGTFALVPQVADAVREFPSLHLAALPMAGASLQLSRSARAASKSARPFFSVPRRSCQRLMRAPSARLAMTEQW